MLYVRLQAPSRLVLYYYSILTKHKRSLRKGTPPPPPSRFLSSDAGEGDGQQRQPDLTGLNRGNSGDQSRTVETLVLTTRFPGK